MQRPAPSPHPAEDRRPAGVPPGRRIYALGDIHGRIDLFEAMVEAIERDDAAMQQAETTVILLGDLIDRGPASAEVVSLAREWGRRREVRVIAGNHEEMFLASLRDREILRYFLRYGGRETLLSYGIEPGPGKVADLKAVQTLMAERIPAEDIAFIKSFEDCIAIGDYAFVHAGIAPGRPLERQVPEDTRWIREPFLSHAEPHTHVVVHGHTVVKRAQLRANRIGIDTGGFKSGRLTALVLEGTARRLMETSVTEGTVSVLAGKAE